MLNSAGTTLGRYYPESGTLTSTGTGSIRQFSAESSEPFGSTSSSTYSSCRYLPSVAVRILNIDARVLAVQPLLQN